ncbi:MAG: hypothetical protein ABI862_17740 [Ilumatobacteraceae bacterium]
MDPFVAALLTPTPSPDGMRFGIVTQAAPLLVRVGAETTATACRRLASYVPVLGDFAVIYVQGADRVALGKTIT